MKKLLLIAAVATFGVFTANAQVNVDHSIQLTGSGVNARVTGIKNVSASQDVVNVNYLQRDSLKFALATDSGTSSNPYLVNLTPALNPAVLTVGMAVMFEAQTACSTGPVYLNVNSTGNAAVKKYYNVDLATSDIQKGQMVIVMYDGTYWQMLSQLGNAPSSAGDPMLTYTTNGF